MSIILVTRLAWRGYPSEPCYTSRVKKSKFDNKCDDYDYDNDEAHACANFFTLCSHAASGGTKVVFVVVLFFVENTHLGD